jgi:hypothetical protein
MMGNLLSLLQSEPEGVRPGYGLQGAQISPQRSAYEPTLAPGETRSREDLLSMLAGVIEAAGMAVVPGVGPRKSEQRAPARVRGGPVRFITSQDYLNEEVIKAKSAQKDYTVKVISLPEVGPGVKMVVDGNHALAAALRDGIKPKVVEIKDKDYLAGKEHLESWLARHQDGPDWRFIEKDGTRGTTVF